MVLDRLLGYQISPILWQKVRKGLSAGRVQSVTTKLICEREEEIKAFEPKEYWSIELIASNNLSKTLLACCASTKFKFIFLGLFIAFFIASFVISLNSILHFSSSSIFKI